MDAILRKIKATGGRLTAVRKEIIAVLRKSSCLMSGADVAAALRKRGLHPDRSTIFRVLAFLAEQGIAMKKSISGLDYFEIPQQRHDHLVCVHCNSIKKIDADSHLEKQEKRIAAQEQFTVTHHSLEFYGCCKNCRG